MPRYSFSLNESIPAADSDATGDFADNQAAMDHAKLVAKDLTRSLAAQRGLRVVIRNEAGDQIGDVLLVNEQCMSFYTLPGVRGFDREPIMADAEPSKRLTRDLCLAKAKECREMTRLHANSAHRTMLEHMAETWDRIAKAIPSNGGE